MPNTIYLDPSAGTPAVIEVDGVCYKLSGPTPVPPSTASYDSSSSDCATCNCPCGWGPVNTDSGSSPLPSGYAVGFTDPNTKFKTITYTGCDPEGESTVSWTLDEETCTWVETTGNRVPDFIHNEPCGPVSNTLWQCTGSQGPPCSGSNDQIELSNPVTC